MTAATVVLPTTGDRGPLLPFSVGSVLAQSVPDVQVLLIGDGLDRAGAAIARSLEADDRRVQFHDLDKGDRRGEVERHRIIAEHATGEIVTYLCDRDLYLPWHIETMLDLLADADFAHTLRFRIGIDDEIIPGTFPDIARTSNREPGWCRIPLTFAGHRLDFYRSLPHGWRTTPPNWGTDTYMWDQMLGSDRCRFAASARPTAVTFKRGPHPGWPTADRLAILDRWAPRIAESSLESSLLLDLIAAHVAQAAVDGGSPYASRVRALRIVERRVRSSLQLLTERRR